MKSRDIKTIDVYVKEWFDRIGGNSYFSARVTVNAGRKNETQIFVPFGYGYGNHYEHEVFRAIKKGLNTFRKFDKNAIYWRVYRHYDIKYSHTITDNHLKKDVVAWGKSEE
jgi:hypothetical protein